MDAEFSQIFQQCQQNDPPHASVFGFREDAYQKFTAMGLPNRRMEEWKYTGSTFLKKGGKLELSNCDRISYEGTHPFVAEILEDNNINRLVFIDGVLRPELSSMKENDLVYHPLDQKLASNPDAVLELLKSRSYKKSDSLVLFNHALLKRGVHLFLPKGKNLKQPVFIIHLQNSGSMHSLTNVIEIEENASGQVVECYAGSQEYYLNNVATHIHLQNNSRLQRCKLLLEGVKAEHVGHHFVSQGRDSTFQNTAVSLQGRLNRDGYCVDLDGENAFVQLDGINALQNGQHLDSCTEINHCRPHTRSSQLYKNVLQGESRGVFYGQINVHRHAVKSNANQLNRNLMLGSRSEMDTRPQLQIDNDDVKCVHGATVGQLNDQERFYLTSRAISPEIADRILCQAFADEVINRLPIMVMQEKIRLLVRGALDLEG